MYLNKRHPKYDAAMEVLCFLPPEPACVPVNDIVADMGFEAQIAVNALFKSLGEQGITVKTMVREGTGRVAMVRRSHWLAAQAQAELYWSEVNAETVASAA